MTKKPRKPENDWAILDEHVKRLSLSVLDDYVARGDVAPGAMAVKQMSLHLTEMGWKVTQWVDEDLKRRGV